MTTIETDLIMKEAKPTRPSRLAKVQSPPHLFAAAVVMGLLANWFVFAKPFGVGILLFVITAVVGISWVARRERVAAISPNSWLLLPLFFFATMLMLRTNLFLTRLNGLAVLVLLAYLVFFWSYGRSHNLGIVDMVLLPFRVAFYSLQLSRPVVRTAVNVEQVQVHGRRSLFPILRGLAFVLPFLIIFTLLLTAADTIFASKVEDFFSLTIFQNLWEWFWRSLQTAVAIALFSGGLAYMVLRHYDSDDQSRFDSFLQRIPTSISIGLIEVVTMLVCINVLFATFVSVQFTYLFGGNTQIGIDGFTYADYARRGFFELLAVAIMAVTLILGLNWLTRRESKRQISLFNALSSLLIGFVLVMLVSAFWRMRLYEAQYGYTELRLIVYLFMGWMALTLVWFVLTLWWRPERFAIGVLIAAMGFLVSLNLINPDAFIVKQNFAHFEQTKKIDLYYLLSLSNDATPQLVELFNSVESMENTAPFADCSIPTNRYNPGYSCENILEMLTLNLQRRYTVMKNDPSWQVWQSYNSSRWQAFAALQTVDAFTESE